MQVPHETIAYAMCVCLKFDANRHERHGPLRLFRKPLLRTGDVSKGMMRGFERTHKSTCFVGAKGFAIMKRAGGIKPR